MWITLRFSKHSGSRLGSVWNGTRAGDCSSRRPFAMQRFVKETILRLAEAQVEFMVVGGTAPI